MVPPVNSKPPAADCSQNTLTLHTYLRATSPRPGQPLVSSLFPLRMRHGLLHSRCVTCACQIINGKQCCVVMSSIRIAVRRCMLSLARKPHPTLCVPQVSALQLSHCISALSGQWVCICYCCARCVCRLPVRPGKAKQGTRWVCLQPV